MLLAFCIQRCSLAGVAIAVVGAELRFHAAAGHMGLTSRKLVSTANLPFLATPSHVPCRWLSRPAKMCGLSSQKCAGAVGLRQIACEAYIIQLSMQIHVLYHCIDQYPLLGNMRTPAKEFIAVERQEQR